MTAKSEQTPEELVGARSGQNWPDEIFEWSAKPLDHFDG
jgi:hypothetical protein